MGQTAQSLTCSIMEKPHTGLDECPRILLSCFRARNSDFGVGREIFKLRVDVWMEEWAVNERMKGIVARGRQMQFMFGENMKTAALAEMRIGASFIKLSQASLDL